LKQQKAQLVVVAANCPAEFVEYLSANEQVKAHTFPGSSVQLGRACGKPFMVSALAVVEAGESDILSLSRDKLAGGYGSSPERREDSR
jgi:large subunit ribosomal protein L30e